MVPNKTPLSLFLFLFYMVPCWAASPSPSPAQQQTLTDLLTLVVAAGAIGKATENRTPEECREHALSTLEVLKSNLCTDIDGEATMTSLTEVRSVFNNPHEIYALFDFLKQRRSSSPQEPSCVSSQTLSSLIKKTGSFFPGR